MGTVMSKAATPLRAAAPPPRPMGAVAYSNGVELAAKAFLGNFSRIFDAHSNLLKDAGARSMPERVGQRQPSPAI